MRLLKYLSAMLPLATVGSALDLDLTSKDSIYSAIDLVAGGMMDYYEGTKPGGTPGMFTAPYYWWEAGVAFGALIDRWYYTGNDSYNSLIMDGMQFQVGKNKDFMPSNQTTTEGNDDQGFWGIAAMMAAERNFTNPDPKDPQWLALAQAVFNEMTLRWDDTNCGGGLRWQIYTWNSGYDYKNTVSNGCMFNLAARLYRYTGNSTYSDWAEKVWKWTQQVGLIQNGGGTIYDGAPLTNNCSDHSEQLWTYNYGLFLSGSAFMYNKTNDQAWLTAVQSIWKGASDPGFFQNGIMYEAACQPSGHCNNDQRCFKGIFSRFLGVTAQLVPEVQGEIMKDLATSAAAAAKSCSGGTDGHTCGLNWFTGSYDNMYGLGEQISALEVIQNNLATTKPAPFTNSSGGSSKGNNNAGTDAQQVSLTNNDLDIKTKDRAGAGILTVLVIVGFLGTGFWMLM